MSPDARNILYISYDGMTDPLGRSQVLPYLTGLAARGHAITILSCEKPASRARAGAAVARLCRDASIDWRPIAYHKRPPILSSLYDSWQLKRSAARLHAEKRFDLAHCRSYIPAMAGLWLKRRFGTAFLFDMRGFWAEEKVEGGGWRLDNPIFRGIFRFFKRREAEFLREADAIVSLTAAARDEMAQRPVMADRPGATVAIIPCCVDAGHFSPSPGNGRESGRAVLGIAPERPVLVYLGSLGGNYMLGEMLDFFLAFRARRPGALFLFITRDDPAAIRAAAAARSIAETDLIVRAATREEVPAFVAAADLGIAFKRATFSALACSPTKLGEMLAMGVPVVVNAGVGDVEAIMADTRAGVVVRSFDRDSLLAAADAALAISLDPDAIRDSALRWFRLDEGIDRYDRLYRSLGPRPTP